MGTSTHAFADDAPTTVDIAPALPPIRTTNPKAEPKPDATTDPKSGAKILSDDKKNPESLDARRFEVAGFPIIGGNTDIGVQFGAAATFTKFYDDVRPYLWNIDALVSASAKSDQSGVRLIQQSHVLRLDAPYLFGGLIRIDSRASFLRTINAGYFGIGNAAVADPTNLGRNYQYLQEQTRWRTIMRIHTKTPVDLAVGINLRYESPSVYDGSKLSQDLAGLTPGAPTIYGHEDMFMGQLTAGFMYDTRDTEFITTRGVFYQVAGGVNVGSQEDILYGHAAAVMANYTPLFGPFLFASRFVAAFQFGRVPYYDLQEGGAFELQSLFGGENGVRGVPDGRYGGHVKMLANNEIRTTFPRFHLLGQRLRIGTSTFFDAGRVWADYKVDPKNDGTSLGLKIGVGAGVFLQWGEAAIFRVEMAYSPDAIAENPSFPFGIYVSDGLMF